MLNDFTDTEGTFEETEQLSNLLHGIYDSDEKASRILVESKLKEKALDRFHSKPLHVEWSLEDLLTTMNQIFDQRPNKLVLRKYFENRYCRGSGIFNEYCHVKVTPVSRLPIIDEDIVEDYFIKMRTDVHL